MQNPEMKKKVENFFNGIMHSVNQASNSAMDKAHDIANDTIKKGESLAKENHSN